MIHPLESRLMTDPLPNVQSVVGLRNVERLEKLDKTADYTSKDGGGEFYTPPESKKYESDRTKKYYDTLKEKYAKTTEIQLRKTESIRLILKEYGPEMFFLMADYWEKYPLGVIG